MKYHILFVIMLLSANLAFAQGIINVTGGTTTINMVNNVFLTAHDVHVASGDSLIVNNSRLQVAGSIVSTGSLDVTKGTIEMKGQSPQTIAGNMFKIKTVRNLIVSNTGAGLSVLALPMDTLKIKGTLSFGINNTTLNTGDNLTLLSDATETANVGIVKSGDKIIGNVTVERYINIGDPPKHAKSWQLLSAPTTGQSIKAAWMEGGITPTTPNGYGTWITGAGAGFDAYSATPSMKTYNPDKNNWVTVPNPSTTQINNPNGYMVFVRGDRSVVNFSGDNSSPVTTILRTTGNLLTGPQEAIPLPVGKYQSIGNPYASAIDFVKINKTAGVDNKFYVWDPYLTGFYGLGGYQTICSTTLWKPVPGGTPNYDKEKPNHYIQSGQAFLVFTTGVAAKGPNPEYALTFTEDVKLTEPVSGSFARPMENAGKSKRQFFWVRLYTGSDKSSLIADGNVVAFDEIFSNQIDGDDALKIMNEGENFGLKRNGKLLAVEARDLVKESDTIYYSFSNLKQRNYQLRFAPENMESTGLQAYLMDKFLGTETPIPLTQNSEIDIAITGTAGSANAERFSVIFRPMAPLPVTFTSIQANLKNADIQVDWKVENEMNLNYYVVEKSLDGVHFIDQSTIKAINGNVNQYSWTDKNVAAGNNFYRIRSVDVNGLLSYTQIVKVIKGKTLSKISVYPNPVIDGNIHLYLDNQALGIYGIRLLDPLGKIILNKTIKHNKESSLEIIRWNNKLAKGIYQLEITKPDGGSQSIKIMN